MRFVCGRIRMNSRSTTTRDRSWSNSLIHQCAGGGSNPVAGCIGRSRNSVPAARRMGFETSPGLLNAMGVARPIFPSIAFGEAFFEGLFLQQRQSKSFASDDILTGP